MPRVDCADLIVVMVVVVPMVTMVMLSMMAPPEPAYALAGAPEHQAAMPRMITPEAIRSQASKCVVRISRPSDSPSRP